MFVYLNYKNNAISLLCLRPINYNLQSNIKTLKMYYVQVRRSVTEY